MRKKTMRKKGRIKLFSKDKLSNYFSSFESEL